MIGHDSSGAWNLQRALAGFFLSHTTQTHYTGGSRDTRTRMGGLVIIRQRASSCRFPSGLKRLMNDE